MTGFELGRLFKQRIDEPYTGYYDNTKLNALFRTAYSQCIQDIYNQRLNNQNAFDELSFLIAVDKEFVPKNDFLFHSPLPIVSAIGTGSEVTVTTAVPHYLSETEQVQISGLSALSGLNGTQVVQSVIDSTKFTINSVLTGSDVNTGELKPTFCISDYMHYLWGEASFLNLAERIKRTTVSPVFVTLHDETELRTGDYVELSGGLSGSAYVKMLNEYKVLLYSDAAMTQYYQSSVSYSSGFVRRYVTSVMKFKRSDEKKMAYGVATVDHPFFQQGELGFKIIPSGAKQVKIDYIKKPPFAIDVSDNTNDLERYYPYYFLVKLADYSARISGFEMRDGNLVAGSTEQIVNNP